MNKSEKKSGNRGEDRRVQKTRKLLSDALVSLILEKGYDDVSIQDIIDRANVGRSTFYAHYENKEQLLLFGHEHLRSLMKKEDEGQIDFLSFYHHLADKHELAARLMAGGKSEEVVTRSLRDILQRSLCRLYAARAGADMSPLLGPGRSSGGGAGAADGELASTRDALSTRDYGGREHDPGHADPGCLIAFAASTRSDFCEGPARALGIR